MRASGELSAAYDGVRGLGNGCVPARNEFPCRRVVHFDFGLDRVDAVAVELTDGGNPALEIAAQKGSTTRRSFADRSQGSAQVSNWLRHRQMPHPLGGATPAGLCTEYSEFDLPGLKL